MRLLRELINKSNIFQKRKERSLLLERIRMGLSKWNWTAIFCILLICLLIFCPSFSSLLFPESGILTTLGITLWVVLAIAVVLLLVALMEDPNILENFSDSAKKTAENLGEAAKSVISSVGSGVGNGFKWLLTPLLLIGGGLGLLYVLRNSGE